MRVTINGSGGIVTHGDSLSGGGVIEFPVNEPPEFARTLTAYTVTGSAPSRKLRYQGHEIAVESPTATAERAPDTASGGVTVTDGTTSVAASTVQTGLVTDAGSGTLISGNARRLSFFMNNVTAYYDTDGYAAGGFTDGFSNDGYLRAPVDGYYRISCGRAG
jgi:hypothetical protein